MNQQELNQIMQDYAEWCIRHNIIDGDGSQETIKNSEFVYDYFENQWKQSIAANTFAVLLEQCYETIKPYLHHYESPEHAEFAKTFAQLTPTEQQEFTAWYGTTGLLDNPRPKTAVLAWLKAHSRPFTKESFQFALNQKPVQHLIHPSDRKHVSTLPSKPRHTDDGIRFLGDVEVNEQPWRRKQRERLAQEAAKKQLKQPDLSTSEIAFKGSAEALRGVGNTHSERQQTEDKFHQLVGLGLGWREVYAELRAFVNRMEMRRATSILVR